MRGKWVNELRKLVSSLRQGKQRKGRSGQLVLSLPHDRANQSSYVSLCEMCVCVCVYFSTIKLHCQHFTSIFPCTSRCLYKKAGIKRPGLHKTQASTQMGGVVF